MSGDAQRTSSSSPSSADNDYLACVLTGWERATGSFRGPAVPERK